VAILKGGYADVEVTRMLIMQAFRQNMGQRQGANLTYPSLFLASLPGTPGKNNKTAFALLCTPLLYTIYIYNT